MSEVEHDTAGSRFVVRAESGEASDEAFLQYELRGTTPPIIDLRHTFTPPAQRGRGVASRLVTAAFAHARANGMKVVPSCSYIPVWVSRHPDQADLVAPPEK